MSQLELLCLQIKPLCDEIIKNPTIESIEILNIEIQKLEQSFLQQYRNFILLPLLTQIESVAVINKNEIKISLLKCFKTVLEKTKSNKDVQVKTILIILIQQIYDGSKGLIIPNLPEELKLEIIECIEATSRNMMTNILTEFYVNNNAEFIAQIAHICVQLIEKEKYRKIRLSSIKCLLSIFQLHEDANLNDIVIRKQISEIVFIILPKIFATLLNVTQEDDSKGSTLKINAIKGLRLIMVLIFEDYDSQAIPFQDLSIKDFNTLLESTMLDSEDKKNDADILGIKSKSPTNASDRLQLLESLKRNKDWFMAASKRIKNSCMLLLKLRSNPNFDIRYELALLNCELITKCFTNMEPCLALYLETAITLTEDENKTISELCSNTLHDLYSNSKFMINLSKELQSLFKLHLIRMPRIIYRDDESDLISSVMLLRAYIKAINESSLKTMLNDEIMLQKLIKILIMLVELDTTNNLLLEEHTLRDSNEDIIFMENNLPWKQFKYLKSIKSQLQFKELCRTLGKGNSSQLVYSHLLDLLNKNHDISNEILVIINFFLSVDMNKIIVDDLLEEYLNEYHWNLVIQLDDNKSWNFQRGNQNQENVTWYEVKTEGLYESRVEVKYTDKKYCVQQENENEKLTLADIRVHVLHICLILENTGNLALYTKDNFHNFLFKTFHKFLEKAGSSNYMIHKSGMYALNKLRESFGATKVSDLIYETTDYLIYHLKILFRRNEYNDIGLNILCVVLKYSSNILLPYLKLIIDDVLSQDLNNRNNVTSFLKLFEMCIFALKKWNKKETIHGNTKTKAREPEEIFQSWTEILDSDNYLEEEYDNNENELTSDNDEVVPPDVKKDLPVNIELTLTILKTCVCFLGSKNQTDKLIVLRTINEGVEILKDKHENELLPFIHLLWNHLVERFLEKDLVIVSCSLTLLETLGRHSKDFIRSRTLENIVPVLNSFLEISGYENLKNLDTQSSINYTQKFKLQNKILLDYSNLIKNLEIEDEKLNKILDVIKVFSNPLQPKLLQENCKSLFYNLYKHYDPTTIIVKILNTNFINSMPFDEFYKIIEKYKNNL